MDIHIQRTEERGIEERLSILHRPAKGTVRMFCKAAKHADDVLEDHQEELVKYPQWVFHSRSSAENKSESKN
jgi:hypothetical protein